jgi:hypothetical protein
MRRLVIFGDSWTNGFQKYPERTHIEYNLGQAISDRMDVDVHNRGEEAISNQKIANNIFRFVQNEYTEDVAIFIVWSEMSRAPALNLNSRNGNNPDYLTHVTASRYLSEETKKIWPELYDPIFQRMMSEQAIHSVRMILKEKNIPYYMANSLDSFFIGEVNDTYIGLSHDEHLGMDRRHGTLLDILIGLWDNPRYADVEMGLKQKRIFSQGLLDRDESFREVMTDCEHPTEKGVDMIVDKLLPKLEKILKEDS